jgi:hypothetical protein
VLFVKTRYSPINEKRRLFRIKNFFKKIYHREAVWQTAKPILNIGGDMFYKKKAFLFLYFPVDYLARSCFLLIMYYPILTLNFFRLFLSKLFLAYLQPLFLSVIKKVKLYLIKYLRSKK